VHEFETVGTRPHIVYPGNLQGRHIRETGEKGAVLVSVADGDVTALDRLIVDRARWLDVAVDVRGLTSDAAIIKHVEEKLRPLGSVAADRLVARREHLSDEVQAAAHHVHGDIWLERLDVRTHPPVVRRRADPAMVSVDLQALLGEIEGSADLKTRAGQLLADVKVRIPGTIAEEEQDFAGELDQLVAEARDLLLTLAMDEG
jgi:DNA repair exonuclease SbcCD nuclease subunit